MPDTELKAHLLTLAREVLQQSQASDSKLPQEQEGRDLYSQLAPGRRGTAFYNPMRDDRIIGLPSFVLAVTALQSLPQFLTATAPSEANRVVLQFAYDFLERQSGWDFDEGAFAATWSSFRDELTKPDWTYLGICYLENFESDTNKLELGDGQGLGLISSE